MIISARNKQEWIDACYMIGIQPSAASLMYIRLEHLDFIDIGGIRLYKIDYESISKTIGVEQYHPFRELKKERGRS